MTERLHFHFPLSCIGEGNGNPLQCSCLENPRDQGAWRAAVYGAAQSQTRLKRLSSSSSSVTLFLLFRTWRIFSQSSCIILCSHQQGVKVSFSPHPLQHLLPVTLVGVKWYFTVVLVCISLMTNDVDHLRLCLLAISMPSLETCLFKSLGRL